ncbi:titin-like [Neoarius graeffei]|uniref:titin-like n=1 Tax=Neoarius graeffei TaxID=443677 RepID=UPI00298D0C9C|nr:titin-like [Neoarius graeffei]
MEFSPLPVILLLISLLPVAHAQGSPKAVVSIKPDTHVFTGEHVTFTCDIQGGQGGIQWIYSWNKNNNKLTEGVDIVYTVYTKQRFRIRSVKDSDSGDYTCSRERRDSQSSEISDTVTLTVSEKPKPTVRVNPQRSVYPGDTITLSCELQQSTGWEFQWYKNKQQLQLLNSEQANKLNITVSNAGETAYQCRARRRNYYYYYTVFYEYYNTEFSDLVKITGRGESPPVSLIIKPSRTQHFMKDSLSLSCEDQNNSTGWTVRRDTHSEGVSDCSTSTGTCEISSLNTFDTGVYWCHSESGENSNPVNITVQDGAVILESPVHPVTEGHPLTLRCLYQNPNSSNLRADFYKDGSVLQTQTTGEMIIHKVSKSDEGFYHCKHPERGQSLKSWVSVRRPSRVEAPFSVLMLICSVVTASPYLLATIILLVKCYRARSGLSGVVAVAVLVDVEAGLAEEVAAADTLYVADGMDRVLIISDNITKEKAKDAFYYQLNGELRHVSQPDINMVLKDINATVGSNHISLEHITGPHPFPFTTTTNNSVCMLERYATHNLRIMGSWVQHFQIHCTTCGSYTCRGQDSEISDAVTLTVSEKPKATVRVNPQSSVYTGDTITLSCELQQGAGWEFLWRKYNQHLQHLNTEVTDTNTLSVTVNTTGETVYRCGARRHNTRTDYYTYYSNEVRITARGALSALPSVVLADGELLRVAVWTSLPQLLRCVAENPDKQVFSGDDVTLRCDIQDESVSSCQYSWYKDPSHSRVSSEQMYTISGVKVTHTGNYTCRGAERGGSRSSHFSDAVTLCVTERPPPVLSVSPQSWLTEGDSVTLSCEVTGSSTDWTFSWYTTVPYRSGLTQITNSRGYSMSVELLSDSSRGSGGKYTLSPAALKHTGVYMCRGERGEPAFHTPYSNPQPLWITGESPPVSLIINPNRTQHFTSDSLSLSCNSTDQSRSTGWTVRRYTHSEGVLDCSPCKISSLSTSYTGVYWCHSESGENRNPVNITVQDGDVILESPVHPVTEGHPLTLRCLYRNPKPSNLRADFYKDGSVLQTQTTGEMIIHKVSKSDEDFYHCKHPESGGSRKSWVSVRLLVSLIPVAHVQGRVKAVVSINADTHVFIGEYVALRCDTQGGQDTQQSYRWYKNTDPLSTEGGHIVFGLYTNQELCLCPVGDSDRGSYTCRGQDSEISDAVTLTVSGESPPVSLIINPNRTQHFTSDSLSLSCNSTDQSRSTGWTVRRYTHSEGALDCSPCKISSLSTSYTGVYWCHSESGENRNPVNITVQDGAVILESPVHPVTEGHPLTLRCLYRNPKPSNLQADFYKDGSVLQTQTTGEMIILKVSKSDEGFYHCKHPDRGESLKSWVSVRRPSRVEAPFSVLMLICSVVTASPYLLATIILLVKCYRARAQTVEERIENAVLEE